jgi:GMP synthase-like glutamine amidotransferase
LSRRPRVIVVNNDDPDSDYGASHLAAAFSALFETEIVSPLRGFPLAGKWVRDGGADAFVLSGSDRSLRDALPWMLEEEALVRDIVGAGIPLLGICFGHQLIGEAFGAGIVTREKRIGLFEVAVVGNDPAFDGLGRTVTVPEQHGDQLSSVPGGFDLLATSDYCPIQAVRHATVAAYGMQFHPCYAESVFQADEAWAALTDLRGRFRHDGARVLSNIAGAFAKMVR